MFIFDTNVASFAVCMSSRLLLAAGVLTTLSTETQESRSIGEGISRLQESAALPHEQDHRAVLLCALPWFGWHLRELPLKSLVGITGRDCSVERPCECL